MATLKNGLVRLDVRLAVVTVETHQPARSEEMMITKSSIRGATLVQVTVEQIDLTNVEQFLAQVSNSANLKLACQQQLPSL